MKSAWNPHRKSMICILSVLLLALLLASCGGAAGKEAGSAGNGNAADADAADAGAVNENSADAGAGSVTAEDAPFVSRGTVDAVRESGILRVGTTGDYIPMSYLDPETGTYKGFDTELTEYIAMTLGAKVEYVPTSWPTLMEDTLAGKFDLAICGITITDARREQALMSNSYLENGKTILVRAEDADRYTSLQDINQPGVRVMINPGGLNEQFALENLPDATLIVYDVNQEIPEKIAEGEADVMITEIMEAGYYACRDSRLAAPLIDTPFTHGEIGVLLPPGSENLLNYVNALIEAEKNEGMLDELAEEFIYQYTVPEEEKPDSEEQFESSGETLEDSAGESSGSSGETLEDSAVESSGSSGETLEDSAGEDSESSGETLEDSAGEDSENNGGTLKDSAGESSESSGENIEEKTGETGEDSSSGKSEEQKPGEGGDEDALQPAA